jgi:hypothetical protein
MSSAGVVHFFWGALAMASWMAGLFFLRYWRSSRDRLFVFFALGFWALTAQWTANLAILPEAEGRHYVFLLRLLAFLLIIVGVVDKNRRGKAH